MTLDWVVIVSALLMPSALVPPGVAPPPPPEAPWSILMDQPWNETEADQVRIDQRVIIRIPRYQPGGKGRFTIDDSNKRWKEEKIGSCVAMNKIAAVRRAGSHTLDLVTVDRHIVRAYLSDDCEASEFYSGFYMEKAKDGKICQGRDPLHSRTGESCKVSKFRLLVAD